MQALMVMLSVLAAGNAEPVDVVKKYLTASEKAQAAMLPDALHKLVSSLEMDACVVPAERTDPQLSVSTADPHRVVVDYQPHKGLGAVRTVLLVKDGKVMDVRPLLTLAEARLLDGDFNGALKAANQALQFDPGHGAANVMAARVAARLGDFARAEKSLTTAREQSPEMRADAAVAAYDMALLQHRTEQSDDARTACLDVLRAGQFMDGRCYAMRAAQLRGKDAGPFLKELEDAAARNPADPWLKAEVAMLGNSDAKQRQQQLKDALRCPAGIELGERAAAINALATSTLELRNAPCAADAERAVMLDPSQADYRRTLNACTEATLLLANVENRKASRDASVDIDAEARAINAGLLRDKPTFGGRKLPTYQAYTRVRVGLKVKPEKLEVTLSDVNAPKRKTREEDALVAAFMVHTIYAALYGTDAPKLTAVKTQYAGDSKEYTFTLPAEMKPAWATALPSEKELDALVKDVKVRGAE